MSHKKNMSSMYGLHKYGLHKYGSGSYIFFSSSSAINKTLYGGANFVSIADPVFTSMSFFRM